MSDTFLLEGISKSVYHPCGCASFGRTAGRHHGSHFSSAKDRQVHEMMKSTTEFYWSIEMCGVWEVIHTAAEKSRSLALEL